jgi:hypothetical protein
MALKELPMAFIAEGVHEGEPIDGYAWVDWKDRPDAVAENLNKLLAPHKLQFVTHPTGSDEYAFSIAPL